MGKETRGKRMRKFLAEPVMWEWADRTVKGFERFLRCRGAGAGMAEVCGRRFVIAWDVYAVEDIMDAARREDGGKGKKRGERGGKIWEKETASAEGKGKKKGGRDGESGEERKG